MMFILGACGGGDEENSDTEKNNDTNTEETTDETQEGTETTDENENGGNQQTEEPEEDAGEDTKAAQVGDTLTVEGVNITITGVERFEGRINQFEPLQEDHAIAIDVEVENTTDENYFIDSMEFTLYDPEGFELNNALPGDEEALSADLPAGKKARGRLFFDIPATEGTYELHYESMASWDGSQAVWEIPYK